MFRSTLATGLKPKELVVTPPRSSTAHSPQPTDKSADAAAAVAPKAPPVTAVAPTGAEKLIRCLEREGVEYVFGLSGGAAMPIFDALGDSKIKIGRAACRERD